MHIRRRRENHRIADVVAWSAQPDLSDGLDSAKVVDRDLDVLKSPP